MVVTSGVKLRQRGTAETSCECHNSDVPLSMFMCSPDYRRYRTVSLRRQHTKNHANDRTDRPWTYRNPPLRGTHTDSDGGVAGWPIGVLGWWLRGGGCGLLRVGDGFRLRYWAGVRMGPRVRNGVLSESLGPPRGWVGSIEAGSLVTAGSGRRSRSSWRPGGSGGADLVVVANRLAVRFDIRSLG